MIDREKIIKGLKQHQEARLYSCDNCPYTNDTDCQSKLCSDVLALLEEQEPIAPIYDQLLTQVIPRCGKCGYRLIKENDKYCCKCGRAVKWNDESRSN